MLKNYFLIALRNILKFKVYSAINIVGLAVGITCTILILLYVTDELSYDKYHTKADRIYRVNEFIAPAERSSSLPFPTAQALVTDFPDYIEEYVRFFNFQANTLSIEYAPENGKRVQFNEPRVFFADSTLFKVFDFELKQGNVDQVLSAPMSVLVTESTAKKYFGNENPIGKNLRYEGNFDITVSGVLKDIPPNSHFKSDIIISFSSLPTIAGFGNGINNNWYWNPCWTYILLKKGVNPEQLTSLLPDFVQKNFHPAIREQTTLKLQKLTDIHLHSHLDYEIETNSDITLVYIFGIIAVFILLIAGINFVNLSTARSIKRAREVGVRKVMGAEPKQLIGQFLAESITFSLISVVIAIPFVYMFLPGLNNLALKNISFTFMSSGIFWLALAVIILLVGLVGGIYPALFLSSFQPVKVLSGKFGKIGAGSFLRKMLVVSQFAISCILIIGTIITFQQINHLRNANLGFEKEKVVLLPVQRSQILPRFDQFKNQLLRHEAITGVSGANMILGTETQTASYQAEGQVKEVMTSAYFVDTDFIKATGMKLIAGRDFSSEIAADTANGGAIVNEAYLRLLGWNSPEEAIGKRIVGTLEGELIVKGVVKDFHYTSLRQPIAPFILVLNPNGQARLFFMSYVYVHVNVNNVNEAINYMEEKFKEYDPSRAFSYHFLGEKINKLYSAEDSMGKVASVFSIMAIFVACLGLFGLSSFTAEQRTKEIGIRKVVGASITTIVLLLSKQFMILVTFANLIAWPAAYYLMDFWLDEFTTQIKIDVFPFFIAALFTLLIAFITMSFQAIKAASANPIKSLKYE